MNVRTFAVSLAFGLGLAVLGYADDPRPAEQVRDQKEALAHAEQTARRITTSLRVMSYQKLDDGAEQKLLNEVAASLKGLSQDQIKAVLKHLEAAVKAPDESSATAEQKEAYQKHRQVVASLRGMLVKLDALKSLEQAAARIARMADDERFLSEKALRADTFRPLLKSTFRRGPVDDREEQSDNQNDLRAEFTGLIAQLATLKPTLSPDQKLLLDKSDVFAKGGRILGDMSNAADLVGRGDFAEASTKQATIARDLQTLAAALRLPRDKLAEMKEARNRLEALIREEEKLREDTANAPKNLEKERDQPRTRADREKQDPAKVQAHNLADRQDKIEFDARDIRKKLESVAPEAAAKINPAQAAMKKAVEELRDLATERAIAPEDKSKEDLESAKAALDEAIAKAEIAKNDPLAATKKTAEMVEKLIQEQKKSMEQAKKDETKPAAKTENEVAKKANEVKAMPLPEAEKAREALEKASDAAKNAADKLDKDDKAAAAPKQDEALKALQDAKKALDDKAKEIEKRRQDLKAIEDAAKKLEELKKAEEKVARDSKDAKDDAEKNKDAAKEQAKITPPTKEVGEKLKDAAPEAKQKIDEAKKAMDEAKKNLDAKKSADAAEKAKDAAKKLDEAKEALAKKAEELKGKEAADQAATTPNQVNPMEAAAQVEKALEQAKAAAEEAKKAAMKDLLKEQKKVASDAAGKNQPDASKDADAAAKALEKGDLPEAMKNQKAALDKLEAAAKGEPGTGEVAKKQDEVKKATEALAKSMNATEAAKAALDQAQAHAPAAVKPQLDKAAAELNSAKKDLNNGKPADASASQDKAADELSKALGTLNAANEAMAKGQQPGQKPGEQPGQQPGQQPGEQNAKNQPGQQPGQKPGDQPGQEKADNIAEGERKDNAKMKNEASAGKAGEGDGSFIPLMKKERDKVQQAAELAFPAEFRELIKQYNLNIKKFFTPPAKPAPAKPEEKK